jgi:hypothetical protein
MRVAEKLDWKGLTASTCFKHYLLIIRRCCINNCWYIASVLCRLAANRVGVRLSAARVGVPLQPWQQTADIICLQYINSCLCSVSWRWASSARNMQRLLIHNKLTTESASYWSYYTDMLCCKVNKTSHKISQNWKTTFLTHRLLVLHIY